MMMPLITLPFRVLRCSFMAIFIFGALSGLSLGAAYMAQYVFGLQPCILCVYQRYPYGIVIVLSLLGLALMKFAKTRGKACAPAILMLCSLTFLANSALAFYHHGVEQKWWISAFEGCAMPDLGTSPEDALAAIMSAPLVKCDEIPWIDPVLGQSMAFWNFVLCLVLCIAAFYSAISAFKSRRANASCHTQP